MVINDLFDINIETATSKTTFGSKVGLIGFFVCSFDVTNGLQILYSVPAKLRKDPNETNILKTHCIWKIEKIPLRVDLKISEFIYSAFHLHVSSQEEASTTMERPLYGLVIKKWKDIHPLPANAFLDLKTTLESEIGSDFDFLYKIKALESNPVKRRRLKELSKKTTEIELLLKNKWFEFVNQFSVGIEPLSTSIVTDFDHVIPSVETSFCAQNYFKQKVSMRILSQEDESQLLVVLVNQSENLNDVIIQISKRSEFFGETVWEKELENWPTKEDLILEFPKTDVIEKYLIKISSMSTTIDIKSLEVGTTRDYP